MRVSGHESFALRYAWLPKAYRAIKKNGTILSKPEEAMVELGLGKNMILSLRFWVEVMGIAKPANSKRTELEITEFGQRVLANNGFDPFLENIQTLWLLHWKIATCSAPLFAWEYILYQWGRPEWSHSEMLKAFTQETQRFGQKFAERTLKQHLDIFHHTYLPPRGKKELEDSLDTPLSSLRLIKTVGESNNWNDSQRREPLFAFRHEPKPEISTALFEFCLDDCFSRSETEKTLTFKNVAVQPRNIGQVFKLPESDIHTRLDVYSTQSAMLCFNYQPSAILGLITRNDVKKDFLAAIYA